MVRYLITLYSKDYLLLKRTVSHLCACWEKLYSNTYGWFLTMLGGVASYFATETYSFRVVLAAVVLDGAFGIMVSIRQGKFALSKLGRVTLFKISAYGAALIMMFMLERLAHDSNFIAVKVAAAWAIACEFWSMSASILILWPEATFFRILRKHLKGEIAAKLGTDVDDILKD